MPDSSQGVNTILAVLALIANIDLMMLLGCLTLVDEMTNHSLASADRVLRKPLQISLEIFSPAEKKAENQNAAYLATTHYLRFDDTVHLSFDITISYSQGKK